MATYYVSPAGSNISPYDTWEKAATNPASAITLGNSTTGPHTLYIAPGAYNAYLALTDADWDNSTILGTSAHGSISPASKGQVIINTTAGQHGLRNQRASVTIKNISITGADSTHDILYYDGSGMIAENLYLYNGGRRLFNAQGGTAFTLRKSLLKGAGGAASLYASGAGSGTIESSIITNSPTLSSGASYSLQNAGSGAIVVNNSVISGGSYHGVGNTSTGTTTINNSIVSPGENMAGYAIYNPSGAVHVSNSVLMKGWGSYPTYSYAPLSTDTNNIKGFSPAFRRWQRSGFIVPCVDDNDGLSHA